MATEREEIEAELKEEGIVEETPEAPAETEPELPLGEVIDASGEEVEEEAEVEGAPAPVAAPPADPRDVLLQEMRAELNAHRSRLAEMERGGFRQAPAPTDRDAEILARDKNLFQTLEEYDQYVEAKIRQAQRQMEMRSQVAGRIASSEQHARGLLSVGAVGEGYDYDALTTKHVAALEAENPLIAELMQRLPGDPAMNRYTLALVREIQTLAGQEPAKAVKMIRQALTGTKQGEKNILAKIASASQRQADKVRSGSGGKTPGRTKLRGREDVWDMDEKAFAALDSKYSS